ncbi:hypothetical protein LCGC14_2342520 [marine sediment metagenome]|uniref:Uncharacterized protein n=1 Tax=marine sediment metagenome TaxID=412755 RepID=A0A0F9EP92_9ZZZZ
MATTHGGAWLHLIGSTDVPLRTGKESFDVHEVLVSSTSTGSTGRLQIGWDSTTSTVILANQTFTSVMFQPAGVGANLGTPPLELRMIDIAVGTLVFGRCWIDGENGATISMFIGTHEFDEFQE